MPNFCSYGSNELLYNSPHVNYRRHSSYSHEDILNMKYQNPPMDPRYRDSRPFIRSSSNIYDHVRRDFMSRRRSSSSLQEDILRPFQQMQLNEYMRKSSPTMNRTRSSSPNMSDKSNSNWNLNPSIFIEEYNDNQAEVKSNNSSTNVSFIEPHQPLNEESVAPFAGCDEIPFIDDENEFLSHVCDKYLPNTDANYIDFCRYSHPPNPPLVTVKDSTQPYIKNRKTVSFDLMDSMEELNKIRKGNAINKSTTCDHIMNMKLSKCENTEWSKSCDQQNNQFNINTNEPIFKFCTLKNSTNSNPNNETKSFKRKPSLDNDNLSAYFDKDDQINDQLKKHSIIDAKAIALDLSELQSDSTNSSTQNEDELLKPNKIDVSCVKPTDVKSNSSKFAYITSWKPPPFFDKMNFGHGKVMALKNYFEKLKMPEKILSESTPNLPNNNDTDHQKLTASERQTVLDQLREWSEFGTSEKCEHSIKKSTICSNPVTRSVLNLTVTTSINEVPPPPSTAHLEKSPHHKSTPDFNEYFLSDDMLLPELKPKKFPESYIVRKQKISTNIKMTQGFTKSCPDLKAEPKSTLISKFKTNIYNSPCHRSAYLTLRKIKQNQKMNKRSKCSHIRAGSCDCSIKTESADSGNDVT